jgi:hypothetical protein
MEAGGNYRFAILQKDNANERNRTGAAVVGVGYQFKLQKPMLRQNAAEPTIVIVVSKPIFNVPGNESNALSSN